MPTFFRQPPYEAVLACILQNKRGFSHKYRDLNFFQTHTAWRGAGHQRWRKVDAKGEHPDALGIPEKNDRFFLRFLLFPPLLCSPESLGGKNSR